MLKEKGSADTSPDPPQEVHAKNESMSDEKEQGEKKNLALSKYSSVIPEKVNLISSAWALLNFPVSCLAFSCKNNA